MTKKEMDNAIMSHLNDVRSLVERDKYDDAMDSCNTLSWLIGNGIRSAYEPDTRKLIIDFTDDVYSGKDFSETVQIIAENLHFNLDDDIIMCMIGYHLSYDEHTDFQGTSDFYEWLNKFLDGQDCKNGSQIYESPEGVRYLCITGANYYHADTEKYKGTDEVHVYVKSKNWEDL